MRIGPGVWATCFCVLALAARPVLAADDLPVPEIWGIRIVVMLVTIMVVVLCVLAHYEALTRLTGYLKRVQIARRPRVLLLIFAILLIHFGEVWVFGVAYYGLLQVPDTGRLVAQHVVGFLDTVYFSATCYTTLGFGDVVPVGPVRFLAGMEALTGFVLITWSASFTFLEMERFWRA